MNKKLIRDYKLLSRDIDISRDSIKRKIRDSLIAIGYNRKEVTTFLINRWECEKWNVPSKPDRIEESIYMKEYQQEYYPCLSNAQAIDILTA